MRRLRSRLARLLVAAARRLHSESTTYTIKVPPLRIDRAAIVAEAVRTYRENEGRTWREGPA